MCQSCAVVHQLVCGVHFFWDGLCNFLVAVHFLEGAVHCFKGGVQPFADAVPQFGDGVRRCWDGVHACRVWHIAVFSEQSLSFAGTTKATSLVLIAMWFCVEARPAKVLPMPGLGDQFLPSASTTKATSLVLIAG